MPGDKAGRRRVTADPPIAPGRACYKPRRVRAGSSPLVIAHMAVESARLVPGMKSLQLCQLQASENGPDTTERAPLDARGWVPSVFRARPAHRNVSWNVSCSRLPLAFVIVLFLILFGKGQKVKVGRRPAGGASRQLRQPQGEGRAQRVPGYFSRGQLSFPGQQGRRSTLRAARGARGG